MKKLMCTFCLSLLATAALRAAPTIGGVTVDAASPSVRVAYTLQGDEAAVITAAVRVDGEPLAPERFLHVAGDVGHVVAPGARSFVWKSHKDWPNQKLRNVTVALTAWPTNAAPDYLVVDLTATNCPPRETVTYYASAADLPFGVTNDLYKTSKLVMRKVPAAGVRWMMGSPEDETGRSAANEVQHYVTLTSDYYLGIYPVTVGQYRRVRGSVNAKADVFVAPQPADPDLHPVSSVAYSYRKEDVQHWLRNYLCWPTNTAHAGRVFYTDGFLGKLQTQTGLEFDLPTSAQWEFACRAGDDRPIYGGYAAGEVAWYAGNTNRTVAVGLKKPNAWGFYDLLGNVWEWCVDIYVNGTATDAEQTDPIGPTWQEAGFAAHNETKFTRRGSAFTGAKNDIRCAMVNGRTPDGSDSMLGFRVCCPAGATW